MNTKIEETIGDRIKKLRENKGLSQEDLARKCQMTVSYISNLERNTERYENPTLKSITAIADALEVHPTVILYGTLMAPKTIFLNGTLVDTSNPIEVADLMKQNEPLLPLSKDEKELLSCYRDVNNPKEKRMIKEMAKTLAGK